MMAMKAIVRKLAGHLLAGLVPAGHVVEQMDGREGSRAQRSGQICVDGVAVVSFHPDVFGRHSLVSHVENLR